MERRKSPIELMQKELDECLAVVSKTVNHSVVNDKTYKNFLKEFKAYGPAHYFLIYRENFLPTQAAIKIENEKRRKEGKQELAEMYAITFAWDMLDAQWPFLKNLEGGAVDYINAKFQKILNCFEALCIKPEISKK